VITRPFSHFNPNLAHRFSQSVEMPDGHDDEAWASLRISFDDEVRADGAGDRTPGPESAASWPL